MLSLNDFSHEAAAVVTVGPKYLKGGDHPAFKPHHLAVVRVARIPADGEMPALPAIRCLNGLALEDSRGHEFSDRREKLSVINRPAISAQIADWCWLAPIPLYLPAA